MVCLKSTPLERLSNELDMKDTEAEEGNDKILDGWLAIQISSQMLKRKKQKHILSLDVMQNEIFLKIHSYE